jgi:DNA-binding PadR family transcriptional regulator
MRKYKTRVLSPEQSEILALFLDEDHPEYKQRRLYGLEVMRLTSFESGTVYPALARLRERGVLTSEQEQQNERPGRRRVYYTLSDADSGWRALEEFRRAQRAKQDRRSLVIAPAAKGTA